MDRQLVGAGGERGKESRAGKGTDPIVWKEVAYTMPIPQPGIGLDLYTTTISIV